MLRVIKSNLVLMGALAFLTGAFIFASSSLQAKGMSSKDSKKDEAADKTLKSYPQTEETIEQKEADAEEEANDSRHESIKKEEGQVPESIKDDAEGR
jgi:gas vesicle protein